jgi:hypothetical protein
VTLKGVEGTVALFSCVPVELAARKFPSPENCEPENAFENIASDSHTDTASRLGASAALTMQTIAASLVAVHGKMSHDHQKQFVKALMNGYALDTKGNNVRRACSAVAAKIAPPSEDQVQLLGGRRTSRLALSMKGASLTS